MLYEVITPFLDFNQAFTWEASHQRIGQIDIGDQQVGNLFGEPARRPHGDQIVQLIDVILVLKQSRITSYNVCYTKLLRHFSWENCRACHGLSTTKVSPMA